MFWQDCNTRLPAVGSPRAPRRRLLISTLPAGGEGGAGQLWTGTPNRENPCPNTISELLVPRLWRDPREFVAG